MDTVTVACKLPNGLHAHIVNAAGVKEVVTFRGSRLRTTDTGQVINTHEVASGAYGLTPDVPKDFWDRWSEENAGYGPYRQGLIFAHAKADNARAQARELQALPTGLEPKDPDKPGPGLERVGKD